MEELTVRRKNVSIRVMEVQELATFLEQKGMTPSGALRTAVECVYGMFERFYTTNYTGILDRDNDYDKSWQDVQEKIDHS